MSGHWLTIGRGRAPLVLSIPHAGVEIPSEIETRLVSPWLARKDTDWWLDKLYEFATSFDATIVRTAISRTVIDVNRDPSGGSLYPGQATTELCPTTTFDGEPLYQRGDVPDAAEIDRRKRAGSCLITRPFRPRRSGCAACTKGSCSTTPIRSVRRSRVSSKASCRTSTSARMAERAVHPS